MASILVSEVDPDVRRLLVLLVERCGCSPVVLHPDVVIPPRADALVVDPVSPVGIEHARLVRVFSPELPVICLNSLPDAARFLERGPTFFLPKPFAPEELTAVIETALGTGIPDSGDTRSSVVRMG